MKIIPQFIIPTQNHHLFSYPIITLVSRVKVNRMSVNAVDIGSKVEPQMRKCETNTKATRGVLVVEFGDKVQPPPVNATVPKASDAMKEPPSKSSGAGNYLCTPKGISCCILATENTRVFCSIMISILVILSYVNLPRNIVKPKNTIASRPLYVLLLTDFSIVITYWTPNS